MIAVLLLVFFFALAIVFGVVAYTSNNRKRSDSAENSKPTDRNNSQSRPMAHN